MTPLAQMDVIEVDPLGKPVRSRELLLDLIIEQGHTRTPIKKWGRIVGFIHTKDLLSLILKDPGTDITALVRAAVDLKSEMRVGDLLQLFKEKGFHMGFVYNRQGQIVGMVTLEDVMEEITGEILDEYDIALPSEDKK
jgi:CBS domain containing-hemolysin-like protein